MFRERMPTIVLTGVKGVGKTTLAARLGALLNLPHADYADYMLEVTGLTEKAALDDLSPEQRARAIRAVCDLFEQQFRRDPSPESCLLLTNHLTIIQDGTITAPDRAVHRSLHMLGLVVVFATAQEVLERRRTDSLRPRPHDSASLIRRQQRANAGEARAIADSDQIPLRFFCNRRGSPPTESLVAWLTSLRRVANPKGA
jgi:adenylate kinase